MLLYSSLICNVIDVPLYGYVYVLSYSVVSDSCEPKDSSPPGSSVPGILQVRILMWVAIPFSRGCSQLRD